MEIYDIVTKLVGPIEPVGESHTDRKRYENLKEMYSLVCNLVRDIYSVSKNTERHEDSMKQAGILARGILFSLKDYTDSAGDDDG